MEIFAVRNKQGNWANGWGFGQMKDAKFYANKSAAHMRVTKSLPQDWDTDENLDPGRIPEVVVFGLVEREVISQEERIMKIKERKYRARERNEY